MIRLTDDLWVGVVHDVDHAPLEAMGVRCVLCVAQDYQCRVGWASGLESAQVGLIDGPGNPLTAYYGAVLALATLLSRGPTLVYSHDPGRVMVVCMMYLNALQRRGWGGILEMLSERVEIDLPVPSAIHRAAFDKVDWRTLGRLIQC